MSKMPTKKNEVDTKTEVKVLLNTHGWFWWSPPARAYGKTGIADIHAVKNGVFLAIETKRGTGKPKPTVNQIDFLRAITKADCFAFVVNDNRIDALGAFLMAFEKATAAQIKEQEPEAEDGAMMLDAIKEMTQELV